MDMFKTFIIIMLSILIFSSCKPGQDTDIQKSIEEELNEMMELKKVPSLTAVIIRDNQVVWSVNLGEYDIEQNKVPDGETIYMLMSVSKVLVGTVIMQLAEEGRLDLDADVNRYLPFQVRSPHFPDVPITCRMLMGHKSGLLRPELKDDPWFYTMYEGDSAPLIKDWIADYFDPSGLKLSFLWSSDKPGKVGHYSNIGITLLAYIAEQICEADFDEICRKRIYLPLEMSRTGFWIKDLDKGNMASPYSKDLQVYPFYSYNQFPSGTARSSINDFAKLIVAYMNGGKYSNKQLLSEDSVNQMLVLQDEFSRRCLIWKRFFDNSYGHSGGGRGFSTHVEFNSVTKTAFLIFANADHNESIWFGGEIYSIVRKKALTFQ